MNTYGKRNHFLSYGSATFSISDHINPQANKNKTNFFKLVINIRKPFSYSSNIQSGRGLVATPLKITGTSLPVPEVPSLKTRGKSPNTSSCFLEVSTIILTPSGNSKSRLKSCSIRHL